MYKVAYSDQVEKDLKKLDKPVIKKILDRVEKHLAKDPKQLGKMLKGKFEGYWRYRWGNYRVIYKISEKEILIVVFRIAHRKSIYT